jgi:hypothetical protein
MINEFFCWLTGHQSFSGALGTKIYKRQGSRFVYTGMDLYACKCCNKHFMKVNLSHQTVGFKGWFDDGS